MTSRYLIARSRRRAANGSKAPLLVAVAGGLVLFFGLMSMVVSLAFAGLAATGVGATFAYVREAVFTDLPDASQLGARPLAQVTQIYDRSGQVLLHEFYEERRVNVPLHAVSPYVIQAVVAAEDGSFYTHHGFDPRGIVRAILRDITGTTASLQGGSTITQQLVRDTFLSREQTVPRKLRELTLAVQVETQFTKNEILEMFLNQMYFGNQAYGIEAAALSYFGKHARDLDLAEAAMIIGLLPAPSEYSPVVNPSLARRQQAGVLENMVRLGMISRAEAEAAKEQGRQMAFRAPRVDIKHPHFVFYVREVLKRTLEPEVLRRGLKVITSLDLELQAAAEAAVRQRVDELQGRAVNNGALVALQAETGEILAMVGSYDFYDVDIDGQVNVTVAERQPGSAFKPFTYATALASGKWTPASLIHDRAIEYELSAADPSERQFKPRNYDDDWHGYLTLREALANSHNIPAVILLDRVGVGRVIETARTMGITTYLPPVLSLTLGSGGVRLLEMARAYAVFANNGLYYDTSPILRITDQEDRPVWEHRPQAKPVLIPEVAFMITDILSDEQTRQAIFGTTLNVGVPAAVKTGTTNDYRDSWAVGYTPDLVVGVWVGNTDNSEMRRVPGSQGGGVIWRNFMQVATRGRQPQRFVPPPGLVQSAVCGYPEYFLRSALPQAEDCTKPPPVPTATNPAASPPTPTVIPIWTPLPAAGRPVAGPEPLPTPGPTATPVPAGPPVVRP